MMCWRECGSLLNLGLRVSEVFWWVLRVWGGRCYVGDVLMCWEMIVCGVVGRCYGVELIAFGVVVM